MQRMYLDYKSQLVSPDQSGQHEAYPMCRVVLAIKADNFNNAHLERLIQRADRIINVEDIFHRLRHRTLGQENEGIALAGRVAFCY